MQGATPSLILCCKCGSSMHSNPTNMCEACLTTECDITANIEKNHTVVFCPKCDRFLNPPTQWIPAALESPELLSLCLKKVKGLGKNNKLKEASFIFTEPHSRRLIIQIVVRGELYASTVVEQKAHLHFVMQPQQCSDCTRHEAKDYWNACVQIRQKVNHKRTLHYLEQTLLRKKAPRNYSSVKQVKGGMDFYFATRSKAVSFAEFVGKIIPCRTQTSQQLKSHDVHNNTYNYKWTYCLEVAPVCKHDVVCLPKAFAHRLGFAHQILIVGRITDNIRLVDPITCQIRDVDVQTYFAHPFSAISNARNLTEFFVMDVEEEDVNFKGSVPPSIASSVTSLATLGTGTTTTTVSRIKPISAWVVPSTSLGSDTADGESVFTRCHLGHILKIGDSVNGLDLRIANINNVEFDGIPVDKRPEVVLVQRLHISSNSPRKLKRKRTFTEATTTAGAEDDEEDIFTDDSEDEEEEQFFDADCEPAETPNERMQTDE